MSDSDDELTQQSRICLALMRLGTRMAAQFDVWFAEQNITQAQFRILLAVWQLSGRNGSVTPSQLADYLFIERPTATVLIAKLVDRQLLMRLPDPADRRSHGLRLTETGGELLRAVAPMATRRAANTLAPFDTAELEQLLALLTKLENYLRAQGSAG